MRDLSVQSINDSNDDTDRANIQKEVTQLKAEVERIATSTKFSGQNLLDSGFTGKKFQVGAFKGEIIDFSISGARTTDMGSYSANPVQIVNPVATTSSSALDNNIAAQTITLNPTGLGKAAQYVTVTAKESANAIAADINSKTGNTGIKATASTELTISSFGSGGGTTVTSQVTFTLKGNTSNAGVSVTVASLQINDLTALKDAINAQSGTTGVIADFENSSSKDSLKLTSKDGYDIAITNFAGTGVTGTNAKSLHFSAKANGNSSAFTVTSAKTNTAKSNVVAGGNVTLTSSNNFSVNSTAYFHNSATQKRSIG